MAELDIDHTVFKSKSEENLRAANTLTKREYRCYTSSVHCLYYSCLQYMCYSIYALKMIDRPLKEEGNFRRTNGTHVLIRNTFEIQYAKSVDSVKFNEFKELFGQLQDKRVESDYYDTKIDESIYAVSLDLTNRILLKLRLFCK